MIRNNYTQYSYLQTPTLALVTNAYGFVIGNSEDFADRTVLYSLAALEAKHRISLLLPTSDHWWNKNSSATFKAFIERMGTEIKSLAMDQDFTNAMIRFRQNKDVLINFKKKYLTSTKIVNDEVVPAVFGVKVYHNSSQSTSELNLPMAQILDDNTLEASNGQDLIPPTFMHVLILLSVTGFKITKSDISLDTEVNYLIYRPFKRLERKKKPLFTLNKHIVHEKKTFATSASDTSLDFSNFAEVSHSDEEQTLAKKIKTNAFEMDW